MSMTSVVERVFKLSHKQFRAMLKKFKRKKKRQRIAQERDQQELLEQRNRENSPNFKEREEDRRRNAQLFEEFEERERQRKHRQWLLKEEQAQILFKKKLVQLEIEKAQREEERKRILEEFEKQQYIENKAVEENQKIKSQKEEALQEALAKLPAGDGPWHNPIAPEHYNAGQERDQCQFFAKTGCCRFGERCSRGHTHPSTSTTILIRGMFSHFSIDHTGREDFDTDMALEYDDKETYQDFVAFYNDVLPEFKKFGKVLQFKVCSNHEPHLRGNVYVQYSKENEAVEAYKNFNGRYYAGKQITCDFTHVIKWRSAICGLYFRKLCPKGINCNFLHVFKNPTDEFWEADRDLPVRDFSHSSHSHKNNHSRSNSLRHSTYRGYSSEHRYRRENSPDYYRKHCHNHSSRHKRSSESSSDEERPSSRSSRYRPKEKSLYQKRKHRDSRSRSQSPTLVDDSGKSKSHKKNKHKKKKKKRSKKSDSENDNS